MTVDEVIEALLKHRAVMGGSHPVGNFADEFGTWHEVTQVRFEPHIPKRWPNNYSGPVGGGVRIV